MSDLIKKLLSDLRDESMILEGMLDGLGPTDWELETSAKGWSVGDQVSHLAYFDQAATLAAVDEAAFRSETAELESKGEDFADWVATKYRSMTAAEREEWFLRARAELIAVLATVDPDSRLPWYGPSMSPASMITARIMETWAHGQDIAEAIRCEYPQSTRIYHVAFLGVRTYDFSFKVHGLATPDASVWVDLEAPDGDRWTWGDPESQETVVGSALDFCYVVTQRRRLADTDLHVCGPIAAQWLKISQAFAGPPTITAGR